MFLLPISMTTIMKTLYETVFKGHEIVCVYKDCYIVDSNRLDLKVNVLLLP